MRTRLGIPGYESSGPGEAAKELLKIIGGDQNEIHELHPNTV